MLNYKIKINIILSYDYMSKFYNKKKYIYTKEDEDTPLNRMGKYSHNHPLFWRVRAVGWTVTLILYFFMETT